MSLLGHDDPKIERLHKVEVFQHADKNTLKHVAATADELTIGNGTALIEAGHRFHEAYLVLSGTANVIMSGDVIAQVGPGDMVGELALFSHSSAGATVRATSEMEVLAIPYRELDSVFHENPDLCFAVARQLASRLQHMNELYQMHINLED
ncbi:MAG: Crp/Fnr family transcriptional regulator [Acidimicrobiales bacterium]